MDAVVVDSRPCAGGSLFGCLVTNERGGELQRPGTGSSREIWVGLVFVCFFCPGIWIYILLFFQEFTRRAMSR